MSTEPNFGSMEVKRGHGFIPREEHIASRYYTCIHGGACDSNDNEKIIACGNKLELVMLVGMKYATERASRIPSMCSWEVYS